jgi:hypothetical protein
LRGEILCGARVVAKVLGWPRHEKDMSELIEFCAAPFFGELSAARGFKKVVFARGLRTASNFLSFRQRVRKDKCVLKDLHASAK